MVGDHMSAAPGASRAPRVASVELLRGVAALGVCWLHLTRFTYLTSDGPFYAAVKSTGDFGWLGVEVFFVISGFVVPYSMYRAGYRIGDFPRFVARRLIRLDPPYIASLVIVLAFGIAFGVLHDQPVLIEGGPLNAARIILHLGYATALGGQEWLNPSYWTLAIEFQYYLSLGLVFPWLFSDKAWAGRVAFAFVAALSFFGDLQPTDEGAPTLTIVRFIPLFLAGLAACQYRVGRISLTEGCVRMGGAVALGAVTVGVLSASVAALSLGVLLRIQRHWTPTDFLGRISYSLYLTHWPIGHLALSVLGMKQGAQSDLTRTAVLVVSLGICVGAAWMLNMLIERPAQRWASRVRYGRSRAAALTIEASGFAQS
jgi:peptidoglycan/LPS O-acetylase OafA/YrhL